ncbi:AraC family transcriptional regulator [Kribbella qitaiheensis]|uniref:AraC family transcriptional regulator n=1 Tax=Kribbella qitaiheensis TaxID=1544730 RepID=A0A7G6WTD0_9ACTN|nr:AraC family transcriptional regulator [Kribbella qitaiheensis]QNE17245.1 AraC family transcriptional regulator [Kribbella qitaiheensis]
MEEPPVENKGTLVHLVEGAMAFAGRYRHEGDHPVHTHSFFEVVVVIGGHGVHNCLDARQELGTGDVLLVRPGVWHGYEDCRGLEIYNCGFSVDLLHRELAWTREDPLLGHLLWTLPYMPERLAFRLDPAALAECLGHLDGLEDLRYRPANLHHGDIIGWLSLFLNRLARAAGDGRDGTGQLHPAVLDAMRLMEARPAYRWTLTELALDLHLAPGYLVRIFKAATGLPPMAYLSRFRAELAADRLLHTDEPINRIGESVGWPDQNYFARRFKSHYGLSATTYRARFTRV